MWRFFLVYVFCAFTLVRQSNGQANEYRLPMTTVPENYDLRFEFKDFNGVDNLTFSGVANITIIVVESTDVVTLNLRDLNVTDVTVAETTDDWYRLLSVKECVYLTNDERFEIRLLRKIPTSRRLLVSIKYIGSIRTDMTGLYLSSYEERDTTKWVLHCYYYYDNLYGVYLRDIVVLTKRYRWFVMTQFEPTYARRAFPCYDEPGYKTEFNISVVKHSNQIALSNMPIRYTEYG